MLLGHSEVLRRGAEEQTSRCTRAKGCSCHLGSQGEVERVTSCQGDARRIAQLPVCCLHVNLLPCVSACVYVMDVPMCACVCARMLVLVSVQHTLHTDTRRPRYILPGSPSQKISSADPTIPSPIGFHRRVLSQQSRKQVRARPRVLRLWPSQRHPRAPLPNAKESGFHLHPRYGSLPPVSIQHTPTHTKR